MNVDYIKSTIKKYSKYWLEYDYLVNSADVTLYEIGKTVCIFDQRECYCMISDYDKSVLNRLDQLINDFYYKCGKVIVNFNVGPEADEEIKHLESKGYQLHSIYDSYFFDKTLSNDINNIKSNNIVELTPDNWQLYKYEYCSLAINNRPSLAKLIDVFVEKNNGRVIIFAENNYVLGYLSYNNIFEDVNDVDYIYVSENNRKKGIGTLLAKYYASQSINDKKHALWSNAENELSSKTAIKAGFKWCSKHISFYKKIGN